MLVLSSFLPPWADKTISVLVVAVNLKAAADRGWNIPAWFGILILAQMNALWAGFHTDHDPLDGEWGGKSEPDKWL